MIRQSDVFVLYDEVQYTKGDWRNRNLIKTKEGLQWLTIPVSGHLSDKISKVQVANSVWRKKHWNSLFLNYKKADRFSDYSPCFEELYKKQETNLSAINQSFIELVCQLLNINTLIIRSEEIPHYAVGKTERLVEIVKYLKGDIYISGPKAKTYLDESLLKSENIELSWMDYTHFPEYKQLHPPFVKGVTVLDLLFNQGIEAKSFMQNNSFNAFKYS